MSTRRIVLDGVPIRVKCAHVAAPTVDVCAICWPKIRDEWEVMGWAVMASAGGLAMGLPPLPDEETEA